MIVMIRPCRGHRSLLMGARTRPYSGYTCEATSIEMLLKIETHIVDWSEHAFKKHCISAMAGRSAEVHAASTAKMFTAGLSSTDSIDFAHTILYIVGTLSCRKDTKYTIIHELCFLLTY